MSAVNQQAKQTTLMCTVREIKIYELKVFFGNYPKLKIQN